jgi:hypothetical protein
MTMQFQYSFYITIRVFIFFTILLNPALLLAQKVKITGDNLKNFEVIDTRANLLCFKKSDTDWMLGVNKDRTPSVGDTWVGTTKAALQKNLTSLNKRLKRTRNRTVLLAIRKNVTLLKRQVSVFDASLRRCTPDGSTGQPRTGNPTVTPTQPPSNTTPSPDNSPGNSLSLDPYNENLTPDEVRYILNKIAFGGTARLREIGLQQGLTALVDALVDEKGLPENHAALLDERADFWTEQGKWTNDQGEKFWRLESLRYGQNYRFLFSENPFREWMFMFWHAHFATNLAELNFAFNRERGPGLAQHWDLLHQYSMGNFRDLMKAMMFDSAMNAWLNNEDNQRNNPNQNFAREFLELFTTGTEDPITGAKNYDEESIIAATGYFSGFIANVDPIRVIRFFNFLHDTTPRQVFKGIPGAEAAAVFNHSTFIDHTLNNHPGAPRFIAERLFAQIVNPNTSESVVAQLAQVLKSNNYNIKPVLKIILKSKAMFDPSSMTSCITSPTEHTYRLVRKSFIPELNVTGEWASDGGVYLQTLHNITTEMGQSVFEPPSIFAWKGTCGLNRTGQKAYGEAWLTEQSLVARQQGCTNYVNRLFAHKFDFRKLYPKQNPTPEEIVEHLATTILDVPLSSKEKETLAFFMRHERRNSGYISYNPTFFTADWWVNKKVPRVLCLIYNHPKNYLR